MNSEPPGEKLSEVIDFVCNRLPQVNASCRDGVTGLSEWIIACAPQ